jgi:hypothetical protein
VRLFGWVQEKHLDVPEGDQSAGFLAFAQSELLKISHYKAPRDKMICILNCCKVIFGLIRHTQGTDAGADAFVPILILVVLRANPDNMLSNVEYINRFRNPDKLMGEGGYYLSSLQGAIAFIETMDASSLSNITQEEFESNVEQAIRDLPTSATSPRVESVPTVRGEVSPFATLPGEEPARPLTMPATAAALDGTKRFFQRTGDAAKEAVSRPLTAIGKILDSMQAAAESESGEEDTDEDERMKGEIERAAWQHHQHQLSQSSVHSQSQGNQGQGLSQSQSQNSNPRSPQPQPPSRLLAQLGLSPGPSESTTPTAHTPTPETAQQLYAQRQLLQQYAQQTPGYPQTPYQQSPGYQSTPGYHQSPTPAGAGYQPSPAGYGSPGYPGQYHQQQQQQNATAQAHMQIQLQAQQLAQQQALEASHEAYAREQARVANVTTLTQMFPALGEDVADAVLYSCGDDLGLAIDR